MRSCNCSKYHIIIFIFVSNIFQRKFLVHSLTGPLCSETGYWSGKVIIEMILSFDDSWTRLHLKLFPAMRLNMILKTWTTEEFYVILSIVALECNVWKKMIFYNILINLKFEIVWWELGFCLSELTKLFIFISWCSDYNYKMKKVINFC